eukprot:symbB.v1.2.038570.t1/scaffold5948.1/size22232/2
MNQSECFFNYISLISQEYERLLAENSQLREVLADGEAVKVHRRLFCEASHGAPKLDEDVLKDASKESNNMLDEGNFPAEEAVPVEISDEPMPQNPKAVQIDHSLDVAGRMKQARSIDWDSLGLQPSHPRHPIFSHGKEIKAAMANDYCAELRYDVKNMYKTSGPFQQIAKSTWFENFTMVVIVVYALYMSIDMDLNTADIITETHPVFIVCEQLFCFYFFFELVIRFAAFEKKCNCLKDAWFVFDLALVVMMVAETWVMNIVILSMASASGAGNVLGDASILRVFRLLRLTRLLRMARLIRMVPELLIMVKAVASAARSVGFTLILLGICLYVFAIAFRAILEDTTVGNNYFRNVPLSMHSLFMHGTFLDSVSDLMDEMLSDSPFGFGLMYIFIIMSAVTIMNMLIGVLCEVITAVADAEKEALQVSWTTEVLQQCLQAGADTNNDGCIDLDEFQHMIESPQVRRVLREADVDATTLINFADVLFEGEGEELLTKIPFSEFMSRTLKLRGSNTATVKDLVDLRKWMHKELHQLRRLQTRMSQLAFPQGLNGLPFEYVLHV